MVENVDLIELEDPSLKELLNKTAEDLHKKYNKQRKINERFLKKKTPVRRVFSVIFDIVCWIFLVVGFVVCFSTINTTINGYLPNFAGYSNLVVASGSMVKSGFNIGDVVVIHSVDAKTLNENDKIAFYVYPKSYMEFNVYKTTRIHQTDAKTKYTYSFKQLFGFQSEEIKMAASKRCEMVFHHIAEIYEDSNGERWFKTYGSSNDADDSWWINEKFVVGVEDTGVVSKVFTRVVEFSSKPYGVVLIAIPVGILLLFLILSFLKNLQIAKLELDCVEEKRKITDQICVKNNVGFQMDTKTKFKILAQAAEEQREEYIDLLWKKGEIPKSVKKYYMKKKLLLSSNQEMLKLNRECEAMFKNGENPKQIASHYLSEKQKIERKSMEIQERLKQMKKKN